MTSKTLYTCDECDFEHAYCKHCDTWKIATKEYFYSLHGKLKLNICKECKKTQSKKYQKTRNKLNKKIYNKKYYAKMKGEKLIIKEMLEKQS